MPDDSVSDRKKWNFERLVRLRELRIKKRQLELDERTANGSRWGNPLTLAIVAASVAAIGNAAVSMMNGVQTRQLEAQKAEQSRILEMIAVQDPEQAAQNLRFLATTNLISDARILEGVTTYLAERAPGEGAATGRSVSASDWWSSFRAVINADPTNPTGRDTDPLKLHPSLRVAVGEILAQLREEGLPMTLFEGYMSPYRQRHLYSIGRDGGSGWIVTNAGAWESRTNFGMQAMIVIDDPSYGMWETGSPAADRFWDRLEELARERGLMRARSDRSIVFMDVEVSDLVAGRYPEGGDRTWAENLRAQIIAWPEGHKPIPPEL